MAQGATGNIHVRINTLAGVRELFSQHDPAIQKALIIMSSVLGLAALSQFHVSHRISMTGTPEQGCMCPQLMLPVRQGQRCCTVHLTLLSGV